MDRNPYVAECEKLLGQAQYCIWKKVLCQVKDVLHPAMEACRVHCTCIHPSRCTTHLRVHDTCLRPVPNDGHLRQVPPPVERRELPVLTVVVEGAHLAR